MESTYQSNGLLAGGWDKVAVSWASSQLRDWGGIGGMHTVTVAILANAIAGTTVRSLVIVATIDADQPLSASAELGKVKWSIGNQCAAWSPDTFCVTFKIKINKRINRQCAKKSLDRANFARDIFHCQQINERP